MTDVAHGMVNGATAIMTGGASGLDEAACRLMVAAGARIVVADIQDAKGEAVAADLGDAAVYRHVDVTSAKLGSLVGCPPGPRLAY